MNYSFDTYWKNIFQKRIENDYKTQSIQSKEIIEWHKKYIQDFGPSLFKDRKPRVLDIGCGSGYLTNLFCQFANEVIGVDYEEGFIIEAKSRYLKPKFITGDIYNLDKIDGIFDLVACFGVMQHISDLDSALKNIKLKLSTRDNSKALITTVNHDSIFYRNNLSYKFTNPKEREKFNYNVFSKEEYHRLSKIHGLKLIRYDYLFVLPKILEPFNFFVRLLFPSCFSHHIFIEMQHA